jgi:hypothetical protein
MKLCRKSAFSQLAPLRQLTPFLWRPHQELLACHSYRVFQFYLAHPAFPASREVPTFRDCPTAPARPGFLQLR